MSMFKKKRVQYIAHFEVYVGGDLTGTGNAALDCEDGIAANEVRMIVVDRALEGVGWPVGGNVLVVGLFRL